MIRASSADFDREVGYHNDVALSEPVMITRDGQDVAFMISADEDRRLTRPSRDVYASGELPDDLLNEVRGARMDSRHSHLDDMIADWPP